MAHTRSLLERSKVSTVEVLNEPGTVTWSSFSLKHNHKAASRNQIQVKHSQMAWPSWLYSKRFLTTQREKTR